MKIFLETERLLLREFVPDDAAGLFELDRDPEVHRYLGNHPLQHPDEAPPVVAFIRQQYAENGIGRWAVIERSTGEFMGWAGLKLVRDDINGHTDFYDLGYRFMRKFWRQGFATEAASATLAYAFERMKLPQLYSMADCNNLGSNTILQRLGFVPGNTFFFDTAMHQWYSLDGADYRRPSLPFRFVD